MDKETTKKFNKDCIVYGGRLLYGKHKHWCPDWDGLPIDDTVPEYKSCLCPKENLD